jgi:hypothetical protein
MFASNGLPAHRANTDQFNAAIGLFIPPAFRNIKYGLFLLFGAFCVLGAAQFFFTFPETCGKTIEEIEALFSRGGPHAWNTKKGSERLQHEIDDVAHAQAKGDAIADIEAVKAKEGAQHKEKLDV